MASETAEVTGSPAAGTVPPPEASPDDIEKQIHASQQALASKVGQLEQQTLGGLRDTIGMVNETVSTVQSVVNDPLGAVQSAVSAPIEQAAHGVASTVSNLVKGFDPTDMVRDRPLEAVGAATLAGVVAGLLLFGKPRLAPGGAPGLMQHLTDGITTEVVRVGKELLGSVSKSILERAKSSLTGKFDGMKNYTV